MMYSVVERNVSLLTEKLVKPVSNIQIISRIGGYGMALGVPNAYPTSKVLLLIVELPIPSFSVPFLSFTNPLPFPYPSLTHLASGLGLPRPHKGMETLYLISATTTSKLFRSLYSPLGILYPSLTCPLYI